MRSRLIEFEEALEITPQIAAPILGVSLSSYYKLRMEAKPLTRWIELHMDTLQMLPKTKQREVIAERTDA